MLLLDNHIDNSQYLIKWSVITKAYNTDNGEFYTKYMYNLYKSRRISKKLLDQISLQKLSVLCLFIFYFFWPTDYLQVLSSKYKWLCATYNIYIYIYTCSELSFNCRCPKISKIWYPKAFKMQCTCSHAKIVYKRTYHTFNKSDDKSKGNGYCALLWRNV